MQRFVDPERTASKTLAPGVTAKIASGEKLMLSLVTLEPGAVVAQPTIIEDGVFLGDHVVVLKGVTIGRGSVIGANSVVTRDVPPLTIAAGMPARAIRTWNHTAARWDPVARAGTSSEAGVAA